MPHYVVPTVNRMVHYVPPSESDLGEFPIAALVIRVNPSGTVDLFLFPNSRAPTTPFFEKVFDVPFSDTRKPNTWVWPEHVS